MFKLMIVDDEPNVVSGIKSVIDWAGNNIEICATANDGKEALELIKKVSPDIILSDIKMPNMTGLELIQKLHESGINSKIIFLSGYDDFDYARMALRYGACDYLLKPCMPDEILKAVLNVTYITEKHETAKDDNFPATNRNINIVLRAALDYIHENYFQDLNLTTVADKVFISPSYLSLLFKQQLDINFVEYLNKYRINMAKKLLSDVKYKTYEVAYKVGYKNEKYFSQMFKRYTGITPREFRNSLQ